MIETKDTVPVTQEMRILVGEIRKKAHWIVWDHHEDRVIALCPTYDDVEIIRDALNKP